MQIDAARVPRGMGGDSASNPNVRKARGCKPAAQKGSALFGRDDGGPMYDAPAAGSWPPNLLLSHCPECEERGTRRVASGTTYEPDEGTERPGAVFNGHRDYQGRTLGYGVNGTETVPAFDCLAACDCGATVLAPSGGAAPRCACGAAMWWACPVAEMDAQSGTLRPGERPAMRSGLGYGSGAGGTSSGERVVIDDGGGASRFFPRFTYAAKAAGGERHAGCDALLWRANKRNPFGFSRVDHAAWEALHEAERAQGNVHPTVKSVALMEWLVALVCPPGGRVGDITAGSGGTGIAVHRLNVTKALGASFLGCDICPEAVEIAEARLRWWQSVRHDVEPTKPAEVDTRQRTIFDLLGGGNG